MWIKEGKVYTAHADIRRACDASLPAVLTDEALTENGFEPVEVEPIPPVDYTEVLEELPAVKSGDKGWVKAWRKRPATAAELDAVTATRTQSVLGRRDVLLRDTDWTQIPDAPPTTTNAYKAYRKALWDLEKQPGFPFTIDWPVKP